MKKKLSLFLLALVATMGAWADVLTLTPSNGTYVTSSGNYVNSVTFSTTPAVTVTASANNMDKRQTGDYLLWHSGSSGSSTYTISVGGDYVITAYSVTGEANTSAQTLTAGSNSHEFAVGASSTFEVTGLESSSVSFVQTGANASGLKITSISVTVKVVPVVTSISELSNNKAYYVTTYDRGAWFVASGGTAITSTNKAGFAPSMSDTKQQFAFLTYGTTGVYHLYSISEGKFVSKSGNYTTLTSELGDNVTLLTGTGNANYPFVVALQDGAYHMGISNGYNPAVITFWNSLSDGGNQVQIREVDDFDSSAAMAVLEATYSTTVTVTYEVYDGETFVERLNAIQDKNSAVSIPAALLKNTWYYDYTASGTIGESDCTITVNRTYKSGVVTALSGLSNNKAYRLVTERGTFTTDNGELTNTAKSGSNYTIYNFAIVKHDNAYYLWSVQDGKFVAGNDKALTETPTSITINTLEEPLFKIQCGSNYLNCNANAGGFFSSWSTTDGGNRVAIIEAADFDPTPVIEALTNFAPSVVANIKPFFDAAGSDLFQLKSSVKEAYNATYTDALTSCSAATYDALLAVVSNADNFNLPEAGKFYLVKNNSNGKYMRVTASGTRGTVFADLTAEEAAKDASAYICFTADDNDSKLYMRSQGKYFNWVYNMYGYEAYLADGKDKYVHFAAPAPGIGAFSIALGNGEGENAGALNPGFYALWDENTNVVGGSNNGAINEKAQWTFEEASTLSIDLNGPVEGNYYATLCVPFDVTLNGATAYTLGRGEGTELTMSAITEVDAGTPVLLVGTSGSATATLGTSYTTTPVSSTALTGTYLEIANFDGAANYVLGKDGDNVGFYHWAGTKLNANRAYIAGSGSGVKGFVLNFDDDATGINEVLGMKNEASSIYNLAGQRISKMQKGINIMNGKKIVVK